ncbi:hypothetical protein [Actinoplanes sp. URMC 104]|uniref:hypothetical protein n=1 Tax=Actinoplanes sp. URMC 104 TaxID=3423409 RepID=UPI003F1D76B8
MLINSCSEGSIFIAESANWTAPEESLFRAGSDVNWMEALGHAGEVNWHKAVHLAAAMMARMPPGHDMRRLSVSDVHLSVTEIDDSNWHASAMQIHNGCYFVACSSGMNAALEILARMFVLLNERWLDDEVREYVNRYLHATIGGIRTGHGWRNYYDVRLPIVLNRQAHKFAEIARLFVVLHEMKHIAIRESLDASARHMEEAEIENLCDQAALEVLLNQCQQLLVTPDEVAAAIEMLTVTQAVIGEAHWWSNPQSLTAAGDRRYALAQSFDQFCTPTDVPRRFLYLGTVKLHFPSSLPAALPISYLNRTHPTVHSLPLSRALESSPVFLLRCDAELWAKEGRSFIDGMEAIDGYLIGDSATLYVDLAVRWLDSAALLQVARYIRRTPLSAAGREDARPGGYDYLVTRLEKSGKDVDPLAAVVAGQLIFFEHVLPIVHALRLSAAQERFGLEARALHGVVENRFGEGTGFTVLALLRAYYDWQYETLPIDERMVEQLCRIMNIERFWERGGLAGPESDQTFYQERAHFRRFTEERGLSTTAFAEEWLVDFDARTFAEAYPDRVTRSWVEPKFVRSTAPEWEFDDHTLEPKECR